MVRALAKCQAGSVRRRRRLFRRVSARDVVRPGFNDLFVIRVAGNVLPTNAGQHRLPSICLPTASSWWLCWERSGYGAVTAAVDAYLNPLRYSSARDVYVAVDLAPIFVRSSGCEKIERSRARMPRMPIIAGRHPAAVCLNAARRL